MTIQEDILKKYGVTRDEFEEGLHVWDKKLKYLTDPIRDSERITSEDLNVMINATDRDYRHK